MESLKFEIPKGYQIDTFDKEKGLITFKELPKKVTDRIKTIDDAIAELGEQDNEVIHLRKLQAVKITKHILNYQLAVIIAKALNEKWEPDWANSNEYKYYPWFNMGGSSGSRFAYYDFVLVCSVSAVGSRLCFKSRELAEYAAKQFTDIYKQFYLI